ncbi:MAG: M20/M25/M40 family metallo-hydrolase [Armatimonadetes bacterium]|nr:M20/M25/M40 family metallo-hydrolase [Armatimonadota bacterium]
MVLDPWPGLTPLTALLDTRNEEWTAHQVALCEVPAPAYGEGPRAALLARLFRAAGLDDVHLDELGNVLGRAPGSTVPGRCLAVSAHLDTVFGPEVAVRVQRDGDILAAPGISDDGGGLGMLVALGTALCEVPLKLPGELWLAATVGEESVGHLRGARHLASDGVRGRPLDAFITLDSSAPGHIVRHGTHSANHDLVLHGPGGHAWGDFGVVNPAVALARIVARVSQYNLPEAPRVTFNCGILEAGYAPNVIPARAHGHLNLRSEDAAELRRLDNFARRAVAEVVEEVSRKRRDGPELRLEHAVTEREGGETPADSPLVLAAVAAAEYRGWPVQHPVSSTDANAFMARGIDAVCLHSGEGGGEHTLAEWYDTASRPAALAALAETVLRWFALTAG